MVVTTHGQLVKTDSNMDLPRVDTSEDVLAGASLSSFVMVVVVESAMDDLSLDEGEPEDG